MSADAFYDPMGPMPVDLDGFIAEARRTLAEESAIPPTALHAPVLFVRGEARPEPMTAIGRPLSGRMLRLVGHAEGHGTTFTVRRAIGVAIPDYCRREHRLAGFHDGGARLVCAELARHVVLHGLSTDHAALIEEVPAAWTRRWLERALRRAWYARREWLIRAGRA